VTALFFPANEKLRGIEHALLKQGTVKAILSTFWARPIWDMVRRGLKKEKLKKIFVARVHADQVPILKNLKGTVHNICVSIIFYLFVLKVSFSVDIIFDFWKRFWKLAF
jgi:hypothetical protein